MKKNLILLSLILIVIVGYFFLKDNGIKDKVSYSGEIVVSEMPEYLKDMANYANELDKLVLKYEKLISSAKKEEIVSIVNNFQAELMVSGLMENNFNTEIIDQKDMKDAKIIIDKVDDLSRRMKAMYDRAYLK